MASAHNGVSEAIRHIRDPKNRRATAGINESVGLGSPGVYVWFVDAAGAGDLRKGLESPIQVGLIYAGLAGAGASSATLGSRVARQHVRGNIRGSTFRLTLASVLADTVGLKPDGFRHLYGSGESALSDWMSRHLEVVVWPISDQGGIDAFETAILDALDPPLNLAKRPPTPTRRRLTELRRRFMSRTITVQGTRGTRMTTSSSNASIDAINAALQRLACAAPDRRVTAVDAARELDRLGLLKDSESRPGKPLRNRLREGKIANAHQEGGRFWFIECPEK